jgi:hypothetical protein
MRIEDLNAFYSSYKFLIDWDGKIMNKYRKNLINIKRKDNSCKNMK